MKRSVIQAVILADWHRHRNFILLSIAGGTFALMLLQFGRSTGAVVGSTWFFVALVVLGSMLPMSNAINERKKQTLPFLMSLPLSPVQYGVAKMISTVGMFLVPWLTLVTAGVLFIVGRADVPNGLVSMLLVLSNFTFIGFVIISGVALVVESEGWSIAATVATNSCYGFTWLYWVRDPALRATMGSPVVVWNPQIVTIFVGQLALITSILAITLYLQSRKRDFV